MVSRSAINGLRRRQTTDPASLVALSEQLSDDIDPHLISFWPTVAARDSGIPAGKLKWGMIAWVDSLGYWTGYADGSWSRKIGIRPSYGEWFATSATPDNQVWGTSTLYPDGTRSTTGGWPADSVGDKLQINATGYYTVKATAVLPTPVSQRSFVEIGNPYGQDGRIGLSAGENSATATVAGQLFAGGTLLIPRLFKVNGGPSNITWRVSLLRHSLVD